MSSRATSQGPYGDAARSPWDEAAVPGDNDEEMLDWISTDDSPESSWNIFVPKETDCGMWHSSPNKERHASFGDNGTTASTTCYGDLIQMSRFLGAGRSGVFTIDQTSTSEPCYVASRARDLASRTTDPGIDFSFMLAVPWVLCPDGPLEVRWVHWRWPRYEYNTRSPGVKACFQYMVHEGIVLQQFTLENTLKENVDIEELRFRSGLLIRDLDFLDGWYGFNYSAKEFISLGPSGYGYVTVNTLEEAQNAVGKDGDQRTDSPPKPNQSPENIASKIPSTEQEKTHANESSAAQDSSVTSSSSGKSVHRPVGDQQEPSGQPRAVASVITIFINGKAAKTQSDGRLSSLPNVLHGKKDGTDSNKLQIVIAYKLLLVPESKVDWRNFVISSQAANINHWLQKEQDDLWRENETYLCAAGLSMVNTRKTDMDKTGHDISINPEGGEQDTANSSASSSGPVLTGHGHSDVEPVKPQDFKLPSGVPRKSSPKDHLEYFAWRHLEHILSVCTVPLSTPGLIDKKGNPLPCHFLGLGAEEAPLIALTCGDMSGHRINTSASYFAFHFLVEVAGRLKRCQNRTKYIVDLERRIKETCLGHIRWLQWLRTTNTPKDFVKKMEMRQLRQSGCFAANYWVTGEVMPEDSNTWQPPNTITDTALQILKIAEFVDVYSEMDVASQLRDDIYIPWLVELDRLDTWQAFAWPHKLEEGISTFRLDDHFWIWKALKFLDNNATKPLGNLRQWRLGDYRIRRKTAQILKSEHPWLMRLDEKDIIEAFTKFTAVTQRLSPSNVQRGILQRFTIENDVSRRRMLAVTRSARETRFLLHARDTALFYGEHCGFFPRGSSFRQLWANTIDVQRHHEENQQTTWENTLRYALGILMGTHRHALNAANASDLVKECVTILVASGGHDAFFPGELEGGRKPTIFHEDEYRDSFYHVGFEVNCILLSNASKIHELVLKSQSASFKAGKQSIASNETAEQPSDLALDVRLLRNLLLETMDKDPHVFNKLRDSRMKKLLPFTNGIYASNINTIEEEWLYNYPDFLSGSEFDAKGIISLLTSEDFSSESTGKVIGDTISSLRSGLKTGSIDWSNTELNRLDSEWGISIPFSVVDRKKQKRLGRRLERQSELIPWEPRSRFFDEPSTLNESLFKFLGASRTAANAKKRFIWLPCADPLTAFACWAASPGRERHAMSLFFDRHARYEMNAWDETSLVFNGWQSELHLSFYVLVDKNARPKVGLPREVERTFPGRTDILRRASISFRFDGDFFDRHWTCHYMEHVPSTGDETEQNNPLGPSPKDESGDTGVNSGQIRGALWQRKFLELHLLNQTLEKIDQTSRSFLQKVQKGLERDPKSLSLTLLGNTRSSVSMKDLKQFEQLLQSMEDDLTSALSTVQKWNSREKNREGENPRWTRNDEKKYRPAIKKAHNATEETIGVLKARRDEIRRLKETLAAFQTNFRADLEFHQNENVRYFTYATVIFLPLGFAASFFSMSGVPDPAIVVYLAQFAAAALAVTIAILLSAKLTIKFAETTVRHWISKLGAKLQLTRFGSAVLELSAVRVLSAVSALKKDKQTTQARNGLEEDKQAPRAGDELETDKHVSRNRDELEMDKETPRAAHKIALDVLLGVFFTPLFGASWLVKALVVNAVDLFQACEFVTRLWKQSESQAEPSESPAKSKQQPGANERLQRLVEIPGAVRPFPRAIERLERMQQEKRRAARKQQPDQGPST